MAVITILSIMNTFKIILFIVSIAICSGQNYEKKVVKKMPTTDTFFVSSNQWNSGVELKQVMKYNLLACFMECQACECAGAAFEEPD